MNADALEWRQARQWLINSGLIPATHRVTKPDVDLVDFARSLRDGVFLCSLLNTLKPDCIQDWTPKPLMQVCVVVCVCACVEGIPFQNWIAEFPMGCDSGEVVSVESCRWQTTTSHFSARRQRGCYIPSE